MNLRSVIRIRRTQWKDEKGDTLEDSHSIFLSEWMYMGLMMLDF